MNADGRASVDFAILKARIIRPIIRTIIALLITSDITIPTQGITSERIYATICVAILYAAVGGTGETRFAVICSEVTYFALDDYTVAAVWGADRSAAIYMATVSFHNFAVNAPVSSFDIAYFPPSDNSISAFGHTG